MTRHRALDVLLLTVGVSVLAAGIALRMGDVHVRTVLSGSMRPTISPGDLAVVQGVPASSLRVGDVIAFTPPDGMQAVLHRIVSRQGDAITTRGDANSVADPWRLVLQGPTSYRLVFVIPYLGWLTQLRALAFIAAGLVLGLAIILEIRKGVYDRRAHVAS